MRWKAVRLKPVFVAVVFSVLLVALSLFIPGKVVAQNDDYKGWGFPPHHFPCTPEPGTLALLGAGAAGWVIWRIRRKK